MTERANPNPDLDRFLAELTELSRAHRIGITGQPELFVMDYEDLIRSYRADQESRLTF
ncbi:MAG: hypothetical protein U1E49_01455 [Hyphomicrobiaceae bacterium]